ncbi:MAG: primosomal protein N' [Oscillibacter sp.]|jgi:primosomal protein N' (replication factor Y)|nr:primosomal protein N' [Oscillibacter sp.]
MEHAEIAKVAVAQVPYSIDKPYDYLIPAALCPGAVPGVRVIVPFGRGNRRFEGIVLARTQGEKNPRLKAVCAVLDETPVLDQQGLELAFFLRQRCFCTMYEAARAILPAGLWYRLRETFCLGDGVTGEAAKAATREIPGAEKLLEALDAAGGKLDFSRAETVCAEQTSRILRELTEHGILRGETEALRKVGDRTKKLAELSVDAGEALAEAERKSRSAPLRAAVLRFLADGGKTSAGEICYYTGASLRTLRSLEKAGWICFSDQEVLRIPEADVKEAGQPIVLNGEQEAAFRNILSLMESGKPGASLLEGVTGSGKTEIYVRLVQECLRRGRTAIVLVPEIVLTPQMMRKFSSYFGQRVVMLHSALQLAQRYDQWKRIRRGEVDVVLGTRSAIFSPLKNLGLIVLDEEQESSYRSESAPRYQTRDVAKFRCAQDGAVLVLGSATPCVESAYCASQGIYQYNRLTERYNQQALPRVVLADLRREIRNGNSGAVSETLGEELERNLSAGEQSILFLNRRGNSRMLLCGECGRVPECPRCSVPMTYHSANGRLMCHYCGHSEPAYERCPVCGGYMKRVGAGTQKVEQELRERFPGTEILRMDADTVTEGHEKLLSRFEKERIPILLGTQMVTKGLDFENVTLVGVLSADLSLYTESYLAAERTFSLLTQVIGRAGRGEKAGRAVIQTYTPENAVIQSAAAQDYRQFYESELHLRKIRRCPPFADLFTFTVSGGEEDRVLQASLWLRAALCRSVSAPELQKDEPEVLGPAPAPVVKVNNRFRYRVLLVGKNSRAARECISRTLKEFAVRRENRGLSIFADCNAPD